MPGKSKHGGGSEVKSAYRMKYQGNTSAFPFKSSPAKLGGKTKRMKLARKWELEDREERQEQGYVGGNRSVMPMKSPLKQSPGRGRVPGTKPWGNIRPLAPEVTKTLSKVGKFIRGSSLAGAAYGLFKGYGKLSKTKHGKKIIKQSGVGRTRKV